MYIDGAGQLRTFWSVALRVLTPGVITVFLFGFVGTWNNYFLPLVVLNDPKLFPLTLRLASWQTIQSNGPAELTYNLIVTGALVALVPLIIAFPLLQRSNPCRRRRKGWVASAWMGPGRMMATAATRSSKQRGCSCGRQAFCCARLSIWKRPIVSGSQIRS